MLYHEPDCHNIGGFWLCVAIGLTGRNRSEQISTVLGHQNQLKQAEDSLDKD